MNPQAPRLKVKIKIHKPLAPVRLVINGASTHKIAKHIHQRFKYLINLKYEYNIINIMQFVENICKLKLNPEHKLMMMDIKDLCQNSN
jgi:hypothetical protein